MTPDLLSLATVAEMLEMNPSSIRLWVSEGKLPATKVGRRWMVRREDLSELLANHSRRDGRSRIGAADETWSGSPEDARFELADSIELS